MAHIKGKGTLLKVTQGSGPTLTTITKVVSLVPPGWNVDKIDTTDLDSAWAESTGSLPDPQPITGVLEFHADSQVHRDLEDLAIAMTEAACEVIPPSGGYKYTFTAFVSQWNKESVDAKSIYRVTFALQPVGAIARAASA
jgi:hypothetical protein